MENGEERIRKYESGKAKHDVRRKIEHILLDVDKYEVARKMGISERTFDDKIRYGRFRADELWMIAALCGYYVDIRPSFSSSPEIVENIVNAVSAMVKSDCDSVSFGYSKGKWNVTATKGDTTITRTTKGPSSMEKTLRGIEYDFRAKK